MIERERERESYGKESREEAKWRGSKKKEDGLEGTGSGTMGRREHEWRTEVKEWWRGGTWGVCLIPLCLHAGHTHTNNDKHFSGTHTHSDFCVTVCVCVFFQQIF